MNFVLAGSISDKRWLTATALILTAAGLAAGILLARLPLSPKYVGLGDDGALFAYFGQEILEGSILYEDVWDTKPPGVFYLNALALWLGGTTPWAVWSLELAWLIVATISLLFVLKWLSGLLPSIVATVLVTFTALHPLYIRGGNLTEVYAYLPQILVIAAAIGFFYSGRSWWILLAGVLTGLAFMLKPTYIALGFSVLAVVLLASSNGRHRRIVAASFIAGFALPVVIGASYSSMQAALDSLISAVFFENLQYVQAGLSVTSLYGTTRKLFLEQPMATLIIFSLAAGLLFIELRKPTTLRAWARPGDAREAKSVRGRNWVFLAVFIAFPLELALVAISGRNFGHYFITLLPAAAVACSFLFAQIISAIRDERHTGPWFGVLVVFIVGMLVAWFLEVFAAERPTVAQVEDLLRDGLGGEYLVDDVERYVISHTEPGQTVLAWGYNPGLHFATGRKSPSPYLFHNQLVTPDSESNARFDQLLSSINADPPALILAERYSQHAVPFFGEPELCTSCSDEARGNLQKLNSLVNQEYVLKDELSGWLIYVRESGQN